MKILVVVLLLAIAGSLASALFFLVHDQGKSKRTVNALAVQRGPFAVPVPDVDGRPLLWPDTRQTQL